MLSFLSRIILRHQTMDIDYHYTSPRLAHTRSKLRCPLENSWAGFSLQKCGMLRA